MMCCARSAPFHPSQAALAAAKAAQLPKLLGAYHAVFVEGPGNSDERDATVVTQQVVRSLRQHWERRPPAGEKLLVIQGDPLAERGVSAITRLVAKEFGMERLLVALDADIDPTHAPNADREGVVLELRYRQLAAALGDDLERLSAAIDSLLAQKNIARAAVGKPELAAYYRDFALLQEVAKAGCTRVCKGITVVQTAPVDEINSFSVTSFYAAGLELEVVPKADMADFTSA